MYHSLLWFMVLAGLVKLRTCMAERQLAESVPICCAKGGMAEDLEG